MKVFTAITVGLILVFTTYSQTATAFSERIKTSVDAREYLPAIEILREFRERDRKAFDAGNYDYLLGRLAEMTGDPAAAISAYQGVITRSSILSPYARLRLAQIARSTGNLTLERISLQELIAVSPDFLLVSATRGRLARSFFDSSNYNAVIGMLAEPAISSSAAVPVSNTKPAPNDLSRENLVLLANAYLRAGQPENARNAFMRLLNEMPNPAQPDDNALAAVKALDLMDVGTNGFGNSVAKLIDTEHLRRAFVYQFNRDFNDARLHYKAIIDNYPDSGIVPDAIFQIGRGFMQQGEFVQALQWFERDIEQFSAHPVAKDALLQAASCYAKTSKYNEAITHYKRYIELYPNDERLDRAYLNIVDTYRDMGSQQEALKAAADTEAAFKGKIPEALAVFAEARIYLAASDWQNALATLDRLKNYPDLGGIKTAGGTYPAEVAFLRAFVLEQLGRYEEAIDGYLSIPDGRAEYYGGQATERLLTLEGSDAAKALIGKKITALQAEAKSTVAETSRKALQSLLRITIGRDEREKFLELLKATYKQLPGYQNVAQFKVVELGRDASNEHTRIGEALYLLGLYDEAAPEFEAGLPPDAARSGDVGFTLAEYYRRGDMANRAVGFMEPLWRNVPADFQLELIPREQLAMLYPAPYKDALLASAPSRNVDARFVLSIMRQESRYRATVKSYAAARGLMQFISDTSNKIAAELGRKGFDQNELYDPATTILFGSQYLADLYKQFPEQPAAVAASYNGGDDNMKRWLARSRSNIADRYVPEIAFSQSKDYVYKVMANYRVYRAIYDENLEAK